MKPAVSGSKLYPSPLTTDRGFSTPARDGWKRWCRTEAREDQEEETEGRRPPSAGVSALVPPVLVNWMICCGRKCSQGVDFGGLVLESREYSRRVASVTAKVTGGSRCLTAVRRAAKVAASIIDKGRREGDGRGGEGGRARGGRRAHTKTRCTWAKGVDRKEC